MKVIAKAEDRYTPYTPAELAALKAAGHTAVVAYLGRKTRGYAKAITPEDLSNYEASGMHVIFTFEGMSNGRSWFTTAQGTKDARDVLTELEWLGVQPDHSIVIYYSVDYDAYKPADFVVVDAYMLAVQQVHAKRYGYGPYGGYPVVEYLYSAKARAKPDKAWQTVAWSGGRVSKHAVMYQDKVDVWIAHMQMDDDQIFGDPGWYPRPVVQSNPSQGVDSVQTGNVQVNGNTFEGVVFNGEWYPKYTALMSLPGATLARGANDEVEITVPGTQTVQAAPASATPAAPTIAMVSSSGYSYPAYIIPGQKDLGTAGAEVAKEDFGIRTLRAMGASQAQIEHYLVNWYGYSPAIAHTEARQGYPVLQQSGNEYKPIDRVLVARADASQSNGIKTETITDAVNVTLYFKDGSSAAFVN